MITIACIVCGKKFNTYPSKVAKWGKKSCSRECFHKYKSTLKVKESTKEKMSIALTGEKNHQWKGGIFFKKRGYGVGFNRRNRRKVRERDMFTCQECGISESECYRKLDVHHIDYNKENCSLDNLVSLCQQCHFKKHRKGGG